MLIRPPLPSPTPLVSIRLPLLRYTLLLAEMKICPPLPLVPSGATFSDARSTVTLLNSVETFTDPPLPEAEPADPPVAERIKLPAPDPRARSVLRMYPWILPPLPSVPPLATRVTGPVEGSCNVPPSIAMDPPLPIPTPLTLIVPALTRSTLFTLPKSTEVINLIDPPFPLVPTGPTFSKPRFTSRLPFRLAKYTLPPTP